MYIFLDESKALHKKGWKFILAWIITCLKPWTIDKIYSEFLAFAESFPGGVRVSAGDVDLDGEAEVIVGAASQGGHVRVLEGKDGSPRGIDYFPFGFNFRHLSFPPFSSL